MLGSILSQSYDTERCKELVCKKLIYTLGDFAILNTVLPPLHDIGKSTKLNGIDSLQVSRRGCSSEEMMR